MRKLLATLALPALLALGLAGCGSPCQDLADRICNCQSAGAVRDNCKASVKNELGATKPSSADQHACQLVLDSGKCPDPETDSKECDRLQTAQGKIDCGLAFSPDAGTP